MPWISKKRCACSGDLKRFIRRSRVGWADANSQHGCLSIDSADEPFAVERLSRCTINPDFGSAAGFTAFKSQTEAASCA
jgi:hypothetical protein